MSAARKWFKSLKLKLKKTGKKLGDIFRVWFPKKDKGYKWKKAKQMAKKAKRVVNKVAKYEVAAIQSNHYVKWIIAIIKIIFIVTLMASTIYSQLQGAAMSQQVQEMNETLHKTIEKLNDPGFTDMVETVIKGTIGILSSLALWLVHGDKVGLWT